MFAMLASYILSRTLVPTLAIYLLRIKITHLRAILLCAFNGDLSGHLSGCGLLISSC